ncbi:LysR family transcriptional regulator [Erysipelotrichaceae bacterium MTC7]|nr:LysR family transcriptional regulator [Erysipelotrichaceae bacterium MTC7]
MKLVQLHYFITIAKMKSINQAAQELYVSQPTLTSAIQELEQELGISLFTRTGRGVQLTNEGQEFLIYVRQLYGQYETIVDKFVLKENYKKKFGVSCQHYSFAIKAFVEMAKQFDMNQYAFAIRETKTMEIIDDVSSLKSEVGILFLNEFNRKVMMRNFNQAQVEFHPLICCKAYVYLWKHHPLASQKSITFSQLKDYPCLSFEQGEHHSFYVAEEILADHEYAQTIRVNDRSTMLNLMVGLSGYTLCSGIICEELNGTDFVTVAYEADEQNPNTEMEIGYITRKQSYLSDMGKSYIIAIKKELNIEHTEL